MKNIVSNKDFPSSKNFTYLNTANVGLMLNKAEKEINDWLKDFKIYALKNNISVSVSI